MACVGKVKSFNVGLDGTLVIESSYVLDGIPESNTDKKIYYPEKIKSLTKIQLIDLISKDIQQRCEQIIASKYVNIVGKNPYIENRGIIANSILDEITKYESEYKLIQVSVDEATIKIDSDADNQYDQKWLIKSDGSKTISNITPEPIGQ